MAVIIGNLWLAGDPGMRRRLLTLLHQRSQTLAGLRAVLREHHDSLGDEGSPPPLPQSAPTGLAPCCMCVGERQPSIMQGHGP